MSIPTPLGLDYKLVITLCDCSRTVLRPEKLYDNFYEAESVVNAAFNVGVFIYRDPDAPSNFIGIPTAKICRVDIVAVVVPEV